MERRTLLALLLSLLVITGYPYAVRLFYPGYGKPAAPLEEAAPAREAAPAAPAAEPAAGTVAVPQLAGPQGPESTVKVSVSPYGLSVSKNFGSIAELAFTNFKNAEDEGPLRFLEAADGRWGAGAVHLQVNGKDQPAAWQTVTTGNLIRSSIASGDYEFRKEIELNPGSYAHRIRLNYSNRSSSEQNLRFRLVAGSGLVVRNAIDNQYFEANWIGEKHVEHVKVGKDKKKVSSTPFKATSVKSRHFSSILQPLGSSYTSGTQGLGRDHDFASYIESPQISVGPGETWTDEILLYAGPNDVKNLKPLGLEHVVNFGKLDAICKVLLGLMQMAHQLVPSYGIAIIVLTLGLNVLLFPLTRASFESMKRMQMVQPQVAKIREKFGKDPQKMNKEMMDLYKKYKVNPMGGCLPMILQMPIFISLYVALSKSTDLLNASWLWIDDLASPDVVPLPFALPLVGTEIHVLPLVMVGAMVLQQRISSKAMPVTDPAMAQQQKIMATVMPVFFGFLFYPMPSGLVIYWLTNTIATTGIQAMLRKTQLPHD